MRHKKFTPVDPATVTVYDARKALERAGFEVLVKLNCSDGETVENWQNAKRQRYAEIRVERYDPAKHDGNRLERRLVSCEYVTFTRTTSGKLVAIHDSELG